MSVILGRHTFGLFTTLGDGTLIAPYYPGQYERPSEDFSSTSSYIAYGSYPATTPDNIAKLIRGGFSLPGEYARISTGPCGGLANGTVTAGFPPSPISGSPFSNDTRIGPGAGPYQNIFPRWTGETAWDFNAFPATTTFTAQGLTTYFEFNPAYPGIGEIARFGVSYDTGTMPNDVADGGDSSYDQEAEFIVFAEANSVCCWNDGAEIELNLDVWQIDFTTTAVAGSPGVFTYTLGTASFHSTLTQTLTIDPSWVGSAYNQIHTFTIPKVVGHFTFVNDCYVSSVTGP
jgi:hypothetical protein